MFQDAVLRDKPRDNATGENNKNNNKKTLKEYKRREIK